MARHPFPLALLIAVLLTAAAPLAAPGPPAAIVGTLRVIDADTFDVAGVRIRLHGVDAPERDQACLDEGGAAWPCGAWATEEVRLRWGGAGAACDPLEADRYGRTVARCEVAGLDLGAAIVGAGLAVAYRAYSIDYVATEAAAARDRLGIWRGEMTTPADHRAGHRADRRAGGGAGASGSADCAIKGNVSDRGRIYHVPGGASYDRTRIDLREGERWFCTAAEAEAAGWRAPRG